MGMSSEGMEDISSQQTYNLSEESFFLRSPSGIPIGLLQDLCEISLQYVLSFYEYIFFSTKEFCCDKGINLSEIYV